MIADYGALVAEAVERTGMPEAVSRAPMHVGLAEAYLNRKLRIGGMEQAETITTDEEGWHDLPERYIEMRGVFVHGLELRSRTLAQIENNLTTGAGFVYRQGEIRDSYLQQWHGWVIQNGRFRSSENGAEHDLVFYQGLPPLAAGGDGRAEREPGQPEPPTGSNFLLRDEPELYLYAVMNQIFIAAFDTDKASATRAHVDLMIAEIMERDNDARYADQLIAPHGYTP